MGLTQKEAAQKAGVSINILRSMEVTGSDQISGNAYVCVVQALDININELKRDLPQSCS